MTRDVGEDNSEKMELAIRALRRFLEGHNRTLKENGLVIVPREPTNEMLTAGVVVMTGDAQTVEDIWEAMIDAALEKK